MYGWMSSHYGYRGVLFGAHVVVALASLWYMRVQSLHGLVAAQIGLGLGCGTLGVTRSYVAESVEKKDRTIYLGRLTAAQYAGFTVTPFLGSLMFHFGQLILKEDGSIPLDPLSFPSFLIFVGSLAVLCLLVCSFHDLTPAMRAEIQQKHDRWHTARKGAKVPTRDPSTNGDSEDEATKKRKEDFFALVGLLLNVVTKGSIGCYETIGVVYALQAFKMPGPDVGYVVAMCGFIGVCALLGFKYLSKIWDDFELMAGGIAVMIFSCLLLVDSLRPPALDLRMQKYLWAIAFFFSASFLVVKEAKKNYDFFGIFSPKFLGFFSFPFKRIFNTQVIPHVRRRVSHRPHRRHWMVLEGRRQAAPGVRSISRFWCCIDVAPGFSWACLRRRDPLRGLRFR